MPPGAPCPPSERRAHRRVGGGSMRQTSLCVRACNDVFMPSEEQLQQQQPHHGHGVVTGCDAAAAAATAAAATAAATACGGHCRCGGEGGGGEEAALDRLATMLAPELLIGPATALLEDTRVDAGADTDDASGDDGCDDADAVSTITTPPDGSTGLQQYSRHPKHHLHQNHHQARLGRRTARPTTACADGRSSSERLRWVAAHSDIIEPGVLGGTVLRMSTLQGATSVPSPVAGIDLLAMVDAAGAARLSDDCCGQAGCQEAAAAAGSPETAAAARPLDDPYSTGDGEAPPWLHVSGSMGSLRTPESCDPGQAARASESRGRAPPRSALAASLRGMSSSLVSWLTNEHRHGVPTAGRGGSSGRRGLSMAEGKQLDTQACLWHLPMSLSGKEVQMRRANLQLRWDCEGCGATAASPLCSCEHAACASTETTTAWGLAHPLSDVHAGTAPVLCVQPRAAQAAVSEPLPAGFVQGTPTLVHMRSGTSLSASEACTTGAGAEKVARKGSGVGRGLHSDAGSPDPPEPQFLSLARLQSGAGSAGSRAATPRTPTHSLLQDAECRGGSFSPLPLYMQSLGAPGRRSSASSRRSSQVSRNTSFVSNSHVALTRLSDEDVWAAQASVGLPGAAP
uniref:Uncharacterized protein n=1 Tax=Chlamydomonas euryale TaxID=1486919 RepID=A0A7R9YVP8_9CHLO|mmetsp:Transcript_28398/g.84092  ORF Transcript_28398/g.84092 Transcript_28398/m.84092 type:complete len:626 (+) Transcript_28398:113-1990(+)